LRKQSILFITFLWLILTTCTNNFERRSTVHIDLDEIKERGKLVAFTNYNTIDYFIYRGQPLGFQFELLQRFSEYSGIQLEIQASNDIDDVTSKLLEGKCDLIAIPMTVTMEKTKYLAFSDPILQSRQVLVQRKPDNWKTISNKELSKFLIASPIDLGGKTVVVQKKSAYAQRLRNIADETGKSIEIIEVPEDEEQLVQFVAGGDIDLTVCDEKTAQVLQKYYPQIDVATAISFPQNQSWAIRKNSEKLLTELNLWLSQFIKTQQYAILYNKYYQNQWTAQMVNSDYFVLNSGHLSPFMKI
jgi:membrane-bound lytic murein transglycosylase F